MAIRAIAALILPKDLEVSFLLVDNASDPETKKVFEEESRNLTFSSTYVEENSRGIVHARNRVLKELNEQNVDYLAFFDDDDYPDSRWIIGLWECMKQYAATVVAGKMEFHWPENCTLEKEIKNLYVERNSDRATGDIRVRCGAGNTLLDLEFVRRFGLFFHPLFNLTGGEDSHFFEAMTLRGAKIVNCREAVVHSDIVAERATEEYILQRRYHIEYTLFLREKLFYGKSVAIRNGLSSIVRNGWKVLWHTFSKSKKRIAQRKKRIAELRGLLAAMKGVSKEGYRESDGH